MEFRKRLAQVDGLHNKLCQLRKPWMMPRQAMVSSRKLCCSVVGRPACLRRLYLSPKCLPQGPLPRQ